jgi:hypothetical protein
MSQSPTDPIRALLASWEKCKQKAPKADREAAFAHFAINAGEAIPALTALVAERQELYDLVQEWRREAEYVNDEPWRQKMYNECAARLQSILEGK